MKSTASTASTRFLQALTSQPVWQTREKPSWHDLIMSSMKNCRLEIMFVCIVFLLGTLRLQNSLASVSQWNVLPGRGSGRRRRGAVSGDGEMVTQITGRGHTTLSPFSYAAAASAAEPLPGQDFFNWGLKMIIVISCVFSWLLICRLKKDKDKDIVT